eukprot:3826408-Prymnesium_polylepis.1
MIALTSRTLLRLLDAQEGELLGPARHRAPGADDASERRREEIVVVEDLRRGLQHGATHAFERALRLRLQLWQPRGRLPD